MIPRLRFAFLPTPIEPLPRLSAALQRTTPSAPHIYVKRDDQTGLALGGNKARKLEFLLAEAQANGARTLVTIGAVQSNHCRQVAALAARYGLDCILVLSGHEPERATGNYLLDRYFGAEIVFTSRAERAAALQGAFERAWEAGRRPYLIPLGGSTPVGALGYLFAYRELAEQCEEQSLDLDWIVVASSSGGTQAGLVAGWAEAGGKLHGRPARILGISIDEPAAGLQKTVLNLAEGALERLNIQAEPGLRQAKPAPADVLVNADYLGEGYGVFGLVEREAIQLFARTEGLLLDPVYTGRAAAGLIDLSRKGFFKPGEKVLFWHTGGVPALFSDQYG